MGFMDNLGRKGDGGLKSIAGEIRGLSNFMHYRSYDPKNKLFYNKGSIGFLIEIPPFIGGSERSAKVITQLLSSDFETGAIVSANCWLSPRVTNILNDYYVPRAVAGGIHADMAKQRIEHLSKGSWRSLAGETPFLLRKFRIFMSVELPAKKSTSALTLMRIRDQIAADLTTLNSTCYNVDPQGLIDVVHEILELSESPHYGHVNYNKHEELAGQCVPSDLVIKQELERLVFRTSHFDHVMANDVRDCKPAKNIHEHFDVRTFRPEEMPRQWAIWNNAELIGSLFSDQLSVPCPMVITMAFEVPDQEAQRQKANIKVMRKRQQAESFLGRLNQKLQPQLEEWQRVAESLSRGEKLVNLYYGVTIFSLWGQGDSNERILRAIYKHNEWDLRPLKGLHSAGLLAALPMSLGSGLFASLRRYGLTRQLPTNVVANLAPLQGEYLGSGIPLMMLFGRRGTPIFWSPFENKAGNHNTAVIGKSGSGKSVKLQEMVASFVGSGGHAIVIDDGRSFQNSGKLQGARQIDFTMQSGFSLNVFRMIDADLADADEDYRIEAMSLLKAIIGQMARFTGVLSDPERGIIDEVVNLVWAEKRSDAVMDDIVEMLRYHESELAKNLGISMQAFGSKGTFGKLFEGEPSFGLNDKFTIFELSGLSGHGELRAVVLTAIMFMSRQAMRKMDRSIPKTLVIDEAWQLLQGGSMAAFVEEYARTCRKYGSSLVTSTQSLDDYYKSEGSKAALENSDWMVMLEQKPETINSFKKNERFEMTPYWEEVMRSLKRNGRHYSELLIRGPEGVMFPCRLVIDPFSSVIYSSSPEVFGRIENLLSQGFSLRSIVGHIANGSALEEEVVASVANDQLVQEAAE